MLADEIEKAKQRELVAALDAGERRVAESLGDLIAAPELAPGDTELLKPWLAFCKDRSIRYVPAKPWCVAAYLLDRHRGGLVEQQILAELSAIACLHDKFGLANPVVTAPVNVALGRITQVPTPYSWTKDEKRGFHTLPIVVRIAIGRRENERDKTLRNMQREVAELRKKQTKPEAAVPAIIEKEISSNV
jgi:hypothetical protein